jgi:hypothetical protein
MKIPPTETLRVRAVLSWPSRIARGERSMNHKFLKRTRHEGQRFDGHVFNKKQMRLRRILSNIMRISSSYRMAKPLDNETERVLKSHRIERFHLNVTRLSFPRHVLRCLTLLLRKSSPADFVSRPARYVRH